ncbi:MAG: hypothetical protein OXH86_17695 [Acidimicrobiaceae bacterium]|nr:hypothetical protein [Acidimicrobiaceae bacterium]MDE0499175.1 hypothetical protein [Acidimicrobiaceae bacterium]
MSASETASTPRWLELLVTAVAAGVWVGAAGGLSWWWDGECSSLALA